MSRSPCSGTVGRWSSRSPSADRSAARALGRRDAFLYVGASGLGSFGLGVAAFYLNFVYRALGFSGIAIGALAGAPALGALAGAWPAARLARSRSRRAALLLGGTVTGAGLVGILVFTTLGLQLAAAALLGGGAIVVYSSGAALLADATAAADRPKRFGQQVALGTIAAFLAAYVAGLLARPVAAILGEPEASLPVLRAVVGLGGLVALLSALPILLLRAVRVPAGALEAPRRRGLLVRFAVVEAVFGFGAGSFLPFTNLFFADRFAVTFEQLGLILGALAVAGSLGALLHGPLLVPRLGALRAVIAVQLLSLPFAIAAAFGGGLLFATAALAVRAGLMYGSSSTFRAYTLSSFSPAERAGAFALFTIAWSATSAAGSVASGAVRDVMGDAGWTVNLLTLACAYLIAIALTVRFFGSHQPAGDLVVGEAIAAGPESRA
ncbi:MAG TPA: MFS transporter [Candidatus Limnocylindrales bacterium]|nr:MFS transporter [Candidatus Limnocylindrales bacterium]